MPITSAPPPSSIGVGIVGAGPAGLMAAEVLAFGGVPVDLYDAMPSVGRKFLLAGRGGLNLTHSEPLAAFLGRYPERRSEVGGWLAQFGPDAVRAWAEGLGVQTFVGSSGRVFPADMKAAPLLRAWLHRLRAGGVRVHARHRWIGFGDEARSLRLRGPAGDVVVRRDAWILALGGASWPQLGSDGGWVEPLRERGVDIAPLRASNCGFDVGWSDHFRSRYAGHPLKTVALTVGPVDAPTFARRGEFVVTEGGIEGSLVYAAAHAISAALLADGAARIHLDLLPDRSLEYVRAELAHPRGSRSLSTHLKSRLGLEGVKAGLLHETLSRDAFVDPARLAASIKALPLTLLAARPLAEAISTAGGVRFEAIAPDSMLRRLPGVFCAGEMIDWDAPTGGYLITACLASGVVAACGVLAHLHRAAEAPAA